VTSYPILSAMTFLPLVETQAGNITSLIPSYTISMTDGQIYLSTELFTEGFKPAIDLGLSVSRIGSKVQSSALKEVSKPLRLEYLQFKELQRLTKLKAHLSEEASQRLKAGAVLRELLIQDKGSPVSTEEEVALFEAFRSGCLTPQPLEQIRRFKREFFAFLKKSQPQWVEELRVTKALTETMKNRLRQTCESFFKESLR